MQTRNRESPPNATCLALRVDKIIDILKQFFDETQTLARYGPKELPRWLWNIYFAPGAIRYNARKILK